MDTAQAAQIKPGEILEYPTGWPKLGPQALVEPCEVFGARDCAFSESHHILYFHSADGKRTIELDASWFKAPKTVAIVSYDVEKDEWEF